MLPVESMCPCGVNNPSHDELLLVFAGWTLDHWTNFERDALATSAATCCVRVAWILIDVAEFYNCCPARQSTRPVEILWISTSQAGLTHQQYRHLLGALGSWDGDTSRAGVRRQMTHDLAPATWPWNEISVSKLGLKSSSLDQFDDA